MKSLDEIIRQLAQRVRTEERGTWKGTLRERWAPWLDELTYGVECRDGWQALVEQVLEQIARAVGEPQACPELRITRLKEHAGFLEARFEGLDGERERAVGRILDAAAYRSMKVCKVCGKPGELRGDDAEGWTVECEEHSGGKAR